MSLRGLDSGEATRMPAYGGAGQTSVWYTEASQPSPWEVISSYNGNSLGVQTSNKYCGTTAFLIHRVGDNILAMRRHFSGAPFTESYLGIMVFFDRAITTDFLYLTDSSGTNSIRLKIDSNYNILVYAGAGAGTLKATIASGWGSNAWHSIQLHQATATNTLEIKLDNGSTVNCSGTAMAAWYYIIIGKPEFGANGHDVYFDCIVVNDPSGTTNNTWPGSQKIPTALRPNADDGSLTDWTRSGGTNDFDMIKETSPDLDTTYIYSNADGDRSAFGFTDLAEPANTIIKAVCLTIVAKRADAAQIIPLVSRGGSTIELAAINVAPDYMYPLEIIIETDPIAAGPWTQTNLNNTEFGIKNVKV